LIEGLYGAPKIKKRRFRGTEQRISGGILPWIYHRADVGVRKWHFKNYPSHQQWLCAIPKAGNPVKLLRRL
jgi:hypothetical protein